MKLKVADAAPEILLNVAPPSVLCCHCIVGAGVPLAAAVKLTGVPAQRVCVDGFEVIEAAVFTVIVPAVVVAEPFVFVKTALYLSLF